MENRDEILEKIGVILDSLENNTEVLINIRNESGCLSIATLPVNILLFFKECSPITDEEIWRKILAVGLMKNYIKFVINSMYKSPTKTLTGKEISDIFYKFKKMEVISSSWYSVPVFLQSLNISLLKKTGYYIAPVDGCYIKKVKERVYGLRKKEKEEGEDSRLDKQLSKEDQDYEAFLKKLGE